MEFEEIKEIIQKLDDKTEQLELLECKLNSSKSIVQNEVTSDFENKRRKQDIILLKITEISKRIDKLIAQYNILYVKCLEILEENKYKFSNQEKILIEHYYLENLSWDEVAKFMKKSKSYIWEMHRNVKEKINGC